MQPTAQTPYVVIADDLTGANDAGIQFARAGFRARTLASPHAFSLEGADVVIVNTDCRGLTPAAAYSVVYALADRAQRLDAQVIYAKIDSTLRGNIGPMLDAVLDACGLELAVLCPAFPANARTMLEGVLLVDGQPVAQTAFGTDPSAPVRKSHVPTLLAHQTRRPVNFLPLAAVGAGAESLRQRLTLQAGTAGGITVCDAQTDADLSCLAAAAFSCGQRPLLAGSAGLARALAATLARTAPARARQLQPPVLVVCGSLHPTARAQVAALTADTAFLTVELDVAAALTGGTAWARWRKATQARLLEAAQAGKQLVLTTPMTATTEETTGAQLNGAQPTAVSERLVQALATIAKDIIQVTPVAGLIATGGDSARAVLVQLGVTGVDLLAELAPGIPIGLAHGGPGAGMPVITKAGGFGTPVTLVQAVQWVVLYRTLRAHAGEVG